VLRGEGVAGEAAIYQRRRAAGAPYLAVKFALWLPRPTGQRREAARTLTVRSDATALWIAQPDWREDAWRLNGDAIRAKVAGHVKWRQRRAEDMKYEKRWPARVRTQMVADGQTRLRKQAQRLDSFCHEATAALAGFAARNRVAQVLYDDTDKSWCPVFPWHVLRERLTYKLGERRITFVASSEAAAETPAPLAGET
jgi:hypothetical protein